MAGSQFVEIKYPEFVMLNMPIRPHWGGNTLHLKSSITYMGDQMFLVADTVRCAALSLLSLEAKCW